MLNAFPQVLSLFAYYRILRLAGLLNSHIGLMLIYAGSMCVFAVWNMKGYFDTIPVEIEEASKIDGANDAQMIWRIVLPLAKPAIVVTCVMVLITVWNEYLFATTFLLDSDYYSLVGGALSAAEQRLHPLVAAVHGGKHTRVDTAAADFLQDTKIHGLRSHRRRRERISMKKEAIFHRPNERIRLWH